MNRDKPSEERRRLATEISKAVEDLTDLLNTIPLDDLRSLCSRGLSCENAFPEVLQQRAESAIRTLEEMAQMANEDSIKTLVYLGIQISKILENLTLPSQGELAKSAGNQTDLREQATCDSNSHDDKSNEGKFRESLKTLLKANEKALCAISKKVYTDSPSEPVAIALKDLLRYFAGREDKPDYSAVRRESTDPVSPQPPPEISTEFLAVLIRNRNASSQKKLKTIEGIVQCLAVTRITYDSRRTAQRVAENSVAWPIQVSATADGRATALENYIQSLNLGTALIFATTPRSGTGGTRNVDKDSRFYFVCKTAERLEAVRKKFIGCEPITLELLEGPRWTHSAANLPEFSHSEECLKKWHAAAMEMFEWECHGQWTLYRELESVTSWVKINDDSGYKKAISETLRSGFSDYLRPNA